MTTYALRIDPDGTIVRYDEPQFAREIAVVEFGGQTDVVVLHAPFLPTDPPYVGFVHDWGKTLGHPLNRPAWSLYGRSPIYGTMFVKSDDDGPLDPALCDALEARQLPTPEIDRVMDAFLAGERMQP
jgi:hypothetical protein